MIEQLQLEDLVLQSLEHEQAGVRIYDTALQCALDDDLREEWRKYHAQTQRHVQVLEDLCGALGIDPAEDVPSRAVIRRLGSACVDAMEMALEGKSLGAAQIVACECIVIAETKDHLDWELLAKCGEQLEGDDGRAVRQACEEAEGEEDEHLYHTSGWCRELWLQALGMKAVLPPPEEVKHVKTAIGAARAQKQSERER